MPYLRIHHTGHGLRVLTDRFGSTTDLEQQLRESTATSYNAELDPDEPLETSQVRVYYVRNDRCPSDIHVTGEFYYREGLDRRRAEKILELTIAEALEGIELYSAAHPDRPRLTSSAVLVGAPSHLGT